MKFFCRDFFLRYVIEYGNENENYYNNIVMYNRNDGYIGIIKINVNISLMKSEIKKKMMAIYLQ